MFVPSQVSYYANGAGYTQHPREQIQHQPSQPVVLV
jgi:hypothetical protein